MSGRAVKKDDWKFQLEKFRSTLNDSSKGQAIESMDSDRSTSEESGANPGAFQILSQVEEISAFRIERVDKPDKGDVSNGSTEGSEINVSSGEVGKMGIEAKHEAVNNKDQESVPLTPEELAEARRKAELHKKFNRGFTIAACGTATIVLGAIGISIARAVLGKDHSSLMRL